MSSLRVLIIANPLPLFPGPGAATRNFNLARELAKRHEITFLLHPFMDQDQEKLDALSTFSSVRIAEPQRIESRDLISRVFRRMDHKILQKLPVYLKLQRLMGPPEIVNKYSHVIPTINRELDQLDWGKYDLLQVEQSPIASVIDRIDVPIASVLSWHNIHSAIQYRACHQEGGWTARTQARIDYVKLRDYERSKAKQFDKSIVVSETDASRLHQLWEKASITVVPNGVDCGYFFNPEPDQVEPKNILFTGLMDYEPNVEGILFFCKKVLPLLLAKHPDITLFVVGSRPTIAIKELAEKFPGRVVVTGFVEDVRPYFQRATLCVIPLLNGGGTRLKILEAMSMQKAVVSTSIGCEGLKILDNENILIADTPQQLADRINIIIGDEDLRAKIALNGSEFVRKNYDWKIIAHLHEEAWEEAVSIHQSSLKKGRSNGN